MALPPPMSDEEAVGVLRRSPPCAGLADWQLRLLLGVGLRRRVPRYSFLVREGCRSLERSVYIILCGDVVVCVCARLDLAS